MTARRVVCALAVSTVLAAPAPALGVANGRDAPAGRYPWMATLFHRRAGGLLNNEQCGATLIAPDRLLTAAHCVEGLAPNQVRIYLGLDRLTQPHRRLLEVAGFSVMPGYRVVPSPVRPHDLQASATANDVALILLGQPVNDVAPLAQASPLDALLSAPGTPVLLLGHGRTRDFGSSPTAPDRGGPSDALRQASQVVQTLAHCRGVFGRLFSAGQLCAIDPLGRPPGGACAGDSGGPLVAADLARGALQLGIVIYGGETQAARCEEGTYPDVYTYVAAVRGFVDQAEPPVAPFSTATPRVVRRAADGRRPRCLRGRWHGDGIRFSYRWEDHRRISPGGNGFLRLAAGSSPLLRAHVRPGAHLACVVTGANRAGHFERSSLAVAIRAS